MYYKTLTECQLPVVHNFDFFSCTKFVGNRKLTEQNTCANKTKEACFQKLIKTQF